VKLAKAMRYGGEPIDAADCDYSDFKSLIPLCPNCSEPVFLRKDSDRISKLGKEFKIPQHWSHFSSTSEEQKAACEARVYSYTEADRQRIQSQARGQRLKLIQRWFWDVYKRHSFPYEAFQQYEGAKILSELDMDLKRYDVFGTASIMLGDEAFESLSLSSDPEFKVELHKACQGLSQCESDSLNKELESFLSMRQMATRTSEEDIREARQWIDFHSSEELYGAGSSEHHLFLPEGGLKKKIAFELLNFLTSKSSLFILHEIFAINFVADLTGGNRTHPGGFSLHEMLGEIYHFPWASEFARLEAEAGKKVAA
jgi:hypothetical protein